jgi:hypothetical protein
MFSEIGLLCGHDAVSGSASGSRIVVFHPCVCVRGEWGVTVLEAGGFGGRAWVVVTRVSERGCNQYTPRPAAVDPCPNPALPFMSCHSLCKILTHAGHLQLIEDWYYTSGKLAILKGTLMMEVVSTPETSVSFYQTTRLNIRRQSLHTRRRENLKSYLAKLGPHMF